MSEISWRQEWKENKEGKPENTSVFLRAMKRGENMGGGRQRELMA